MRIIRVTEPLSVYSMKEGIPKHRWENASDRGSRAHGFFAAYANGLFIPQVDWDCEGYFKSYTAWYDRYVVRPLLVEERLTDGVLGLTGQIDLIAELRDIVPDRNIIALIDDKTPFQHSNLWEGQVSAYWFGLAVKKLPWGNRIEKAGTLRLNRDGKPARVDWVKNPFVEWQAYLNAFAAYRHFVPAK